MLPFDSKQIMHSEPGEYMSAADPPSDVKLSFEVIAVIAFFIGCAALFSLFANVL